MLMTQCQSEKEKNTTEHNSVQDDMNDSEDEEIPLSKPKLGRRVIDTDSEGREEETNDAEMDGNDMVSNNEMNEVDEIENESYWAEPRKENGRRSSTNSELEPEVRQIRPGAHLKDDKALRVVCGKVDNVIYFQSNPLFSEIGQTKQDKHKKAKSSRQVIKSKRRNESKRKRVVGDGLDGKVPGAFTIGVPDLTKDSTEPDPYNPQRRRPVLFSLKPLSLKSKPSEYKYSGSRSEKGKQNALSQHMRSLKESVLHKVNEFRRRGKTVLLYVADDHRGPLPYSNSSAFVMYHTRNEKLKSAMAKAVHELLYKHCEKAEKGPPSALIKLAALKDQNQRQREEMEKQKQMIESLQKQLAAKR
ncbi:hypothetical protein BCR33DRAFT_739480 [Rhizoclosmatium globosum]|uniref:Uncharacterized protein n=1 Tax=Rhizoclosmatium globosum TaxID=329046 RepID=A0A1Y2C4L9_9FUNG|nr:hypothetical protein BCR33DRAFT_739480 [Rhizoclosmatium globosum]|eukprot:ORY41973.1 hypothetical protein BCR33DRAFT_739480 [Rhizoclosmatium globosum]